MDMKFKIIAAIDVLDNMEFLFTMNSNTVYSSKTCSVKIRNQLLYYISKGKYDMSFLNTGESFYYNIKVIIEKCADLSRGKYDLMWFIDNTNVLLFVLSNLINYSYNLSKLNCKISETLKNTSTDKRIDEYILIQIEEKYIDSMITQKYFSIITNKNKNDNECFTLTIDTAFYSNTFDTDALFKIISERYNICKKSKKFKYTYNLNDNVFSIESTDMTCEYLLFTGESQVLLFDGIGKFIIRNKCINSSSMSYKHTSDEMDELIAKKSTMVNTVKYVFNNSYFLFYESILHTMNYNKSTSCSLKYVSQVYKKFEFDKHLKLFNLTNNVVKYSNVEFHKYIGDKICNVFDYINVRITLPYIDKQLYRKLLDSNMDNLKKFAASEIESHYKFKAIGVPINFLKLDNVTLSSLDLIFTFGLKIENSETVM